TIKDSVSVREEKSTVNRPLFGLGYRLKYSLFSLYATTLTSRIADLVEALRSSVATACRLYVPAGRSVSVKEKGATVASASFFVPSNNSTLFIVPSGSFASTVTDMVAGGEKEVPLVGNEIETTGSIFR